MSFTEIIVTHTLKLPPPFRAVLTPGSHRFPGDWRGYFRNTSERRLIAEGLVTLNFHEGDISEVVSAPTLSEEIPPTPSSEETPPTPPSSEVDNSATVPATEQAVDTPPEGSIPAPEVLLDPPADLEVDPEPTALVEAPAVEEPQAEEPQAEEPQAEEPAAPVAEEPQAEEPSALVLDEQTVVIPDEEPEAADAVIETAALEAKPVAEVKEEEAAPRVRSRKSKAK